MRFVRISLACLAAFGAAAEHLSGQSAGQVPVACGECHGDIAASYARTGMARSFASVGGMRPGGLVPGRYRHEASEESFAVFERAGEVWLRREQPGDAVAPSNTPSNAPSNTRSNRVEKRIEYQIGSGDRARSFLSEDAQGKPIELPLTWYSENGGHWGMSPGYDTAQHAGFTRKVSDRCFFCHTALPEPGQTRAGIDCQRCHGAGAAHIDAVKQRRSAAAIRQAIVNPARLAPARAMEICLQCHLETTNLSLPGELPAYGRSVFSFRPGEPLADYAMYFDHAPGTGHDDRFEFSSAPYRLFQSACFRATGDRIGCATCHNPHNPAEDRTRSRQACLGCHASAVQSLVRKQEHPSGADCISCHMSRRRPSDALQVTITDHRIRRISDRSPAGQITERNSANLPPYRGKVVPYYPRAVPPDSDKQLYVAAAQVKNQANLAEGIADLERALERFRPLRAEFYLDLADALRHAGQPLKAAPVYRETLTRDPDLWLAQHGLGTALAAVGDADGAAAAFGRALAIAPGETAPYESLARLRTGQGRISEAIATLRTGLGRVPDSADLTSGLGTALLRQGDVAGAEVAFREAVRLRPELAAIHLNLAVFLGRGNVRGEARFEFERALRLDPRAAGSHSAYGTALAGWGNGAEARAQFEMALRIDSALPNTHNNLGIVLRAADDREGAIREYRAAVALDPGFATARFNLADALAERAAPGDLSEAESQLALATESSPGYTEAHLRLGEMLWRRGARDLATPHLLRAAESTDARVRSAARGLLGLGTGDPKP